MLTQRSSRARALRRLGLGLATLVCATGARAADAVPAEHADFQRYCASCHGEQGRGDGPIASQLKVRPADLTQLARLNDGQFPYMKVRAVIDGRGVLGPHGPAEMPVWGERFRERGMTTLEVRGRILNIVDYLASIQEP